MFARLTQALVVTFLIHVALGCSDNNNGSQTAAGPQPGTTPTAEPTPTPSPSPSEGAVFTATLSGDQEVPSVATAASGSATFRLDFSGRDPSEGRDPRELEFELSVSDITGVTAAHVHFGAPGENGPVLFNLFTMSFSGTIVGELEDENVILRPEVGINSYGDALNAIFTGNAYVNVHTEAYPAGEIRGQIQP